MKNIKSLLLLACFLMSSFPIFSNTEFNVTYTESNKTYGYKFEAQSKIELYEEIIQRMYIFNSGFYNEFYYLPFSTYFDLILENFELLKKAQTEISTEADYNWFKWMGYYVNMMGEFYIDMILELRSFLRDEDPYTNENDLEAIRFWIKNRLPLHQVAAGWIVQRDKQIEHLNKRFDCVSEKFDAHEEPSFPFSCPNM
ncbi:MAG: hypothetical protein ABIA04_11240 [Pseudomonadota bacterium]